MELAVGELPEAHVTGRRIWEHEIDWIDRNVSRLGYVFFGAANERPTAIPQRDFYLYFLQPFDPPRQNYDTQPDEVYFELRGLDDDFTRTLGLFAAASELAGASSGYAKTTYLAKAGGYRKELADWLQVNLLTAFEVSHEGRRLKPTEWLKGHDVRKLLGIEPTQRANVRDYVNLIGSICLAGEFEDDAPNYPRFSKRITEENRAQAAQQALRWLGGSVKTQLGAAVLDALELLDGEALRVKESTFAIAIVRALQEKGQGQVVNRNELIKSAG